jgi:hypothetical protein
VVTNLLDQQDKLVLKAFTECKLYRGGGCSSNCGLNGYDLLIWGQECFPKCLRGCRAGSMWVSGRVDDLDGGDGDGGDGNDENDEKQ